MIKKKIIILTQQDLTPQNYKRQGIAELSKFSELFIFNLAPYSIRNYKINENLIKLKNNFFIKSLEEFTDMLQDIQPDYCINFFGINDIFYSISKILKKNNVKIICQNGSPLYDPPLILRLYFVLKTYFNIYFSKKENSQKKNLLPYSNKKNSIIYYINLLAKKIISKIKFYTKSPPDVSLISGRYRVNKFLLRSKKILNVSIQDYYVYKSSEKYEQVEKKYILFLDDCISLTEDWNTILNEPKPIDSLKYFKLFNETCDLFEKHYNLEVIIAGHPQGKFIKNYSQYFNNRKVVFDRTCDLTSNCEFVLSHFSTSIGYAIMYKKPILLLTSSDIERHRYGMKIAYLSLKLKVKLLFMDNININNLNLDKINQINFEKYDMYFKDLIRDNKCNESHMWEELINYLKYND